MSLGGAFIGIKSRNRQSVTKCVKLVFLRLPSRLFRYGVQGWESEAIEGETHWFTSSQMHRKASDLEELGWSQQEGCLLLIACFRVFALLILSLPGAGRTVIERLSRSGLGIDLHLP
jgi:hypothetical protein